MLGLLQLLRFPAVFTAMADIALGYLLTHDGIEPVSPFLGLLAASVCLYWSGMVLNDVFDLQVDRLERPTRPLPSGRVPYWAACLLGGTLMGLGLLLAAMVGTSSLAVAGLVSLCVLAYDGGLKQTLAGPLAMGSCRFLNVMLGASAVPWKQFATIWTLPQIVCAAGLGVYIVGVTIFARSEARTSSRNGLSLGLGVMVLGLGTLIGLVYSQPGAIGPTIPIAFLVYVGGTVVNRAVRAIRNPEPQHVQLVIRVALLSLIMVNATLIFWHTGDSRLALGVAALLLPAMLFGRLIPMT